MRRCSDSSWCRPTAACSRCFRALERGWSVDQVYELTRIDRWFLTQSRSSSSCSGRRVLVGVREMSRDLLEVLKRSGFGDQELSGVLKVEPSLIRDRYREAGSRRSTSASTPARPSSSRSPRISTGPTSRNASRLRRTVARSSSWAPGPTGSGRASSSTTAVVTRRSRSRKKGSRP